MSKSAFEKVLKRAIKNYNGKYSEIIHLGPELYTLVTDLLFDRNIDQKYRTMLLTSVGYFMIPQDLYPEDSLGPIGFIDDLMVIIFVLRSIEEEYGIDELMMYWKLDLETLQKVLKDYFDELLEGNMVLYNEVIEFVGF